MNCNTSKETQLGCSQGTVGSQSELSWAQSEAGAQSEARTQLEDRAQSEARAQLQLEARAQLGLSPNWASNLFKSTKCSIVPQRLR